MASTHDDGDTDNPACPLCGTIPTSLFLRDSARRFLSCSNCRLVFVHPDNRPDRLTESLRYREHQNSREDTGYVDFLRRLVDPVCAQMPVGSRGLDVGCGPVPVLSELLTDSGRPTEYYDPLFFPRLELLAATYDFVTCNEVLEHAHDPASLFAELVGLVRPGGTLTVATGMFGETIDFKTWWYRRDITHVCFFSEGTLRWAAQRFGMGISFPATNVAFFTC